MYYVYLLQSISFPGERYVGYSTDLRSRVKAHNLGESSHTSKFKPWKIVCYFAFVDEQTARKFEHYLKSGSGRAFLSKHFLK